MQLKLNDDRHVASCCMDSRAAWCAHALGAHAASCSPGLNGGKHMGRSMAVLAHCNQKSRCASTWSQLGLCEQCGFSKRSHTWAVPLQRYSLTPQGCACTE